MSVELRRRMWTDRANCHGQGEIMFAQDTTAAKELCATCPVRRQCLMTALDGDLGDGVWGGLDFEERTRVCPVCRAPKEPESLGCSGSHSLERLARLIELQNAGDPTVSVSPRAHVTAPTSPACLIPRGRSHSTAKAYRSGCRCAAALAALRRERSARPPSDGNEYRTPLERFMALVEIDEEDHWLWRGSTNGSGYGNFWEGNRIVRAHLFAYEELVGPLPAGVRLRPSRECKVKRCANPLHYTPRRG